MFYMYPMPSIDIQKLRCMSRLALHSGEHDHPPQSFVPWEAMISVDNAIRDWHKITPTATPTRLKIDATKSLMCHLAPKMAIGMSSQEVDDI